MDANNEAPSKPSQAHARLAAGWIFGLIFTLFVILFGAVVRITGSGAGCGQHWPSCQGELAHLPQKIETVIELTHRVTSGLSMVLVFGLTFMTFRALPSGHPARRAALAASGFMIVEALVGAALVLLELVGENDSAARALVMAIHLVNTMALVAALVVCIWLVRRPSLLSLDLRFEGNSGWAYGGAVTLAVVSAAGAVTALGDTLYPVAGSALNAAQSEGGVHFLDLLRGVHPVLAVLGAMILVWGAGRLTDAESKGTDRDAALGPRTKAARVIVSLIVAQIFLGLINIGLSAPGWMQVIHLAFANFVWIAWLWGWLHVASGVGGSTNRA